MSGKGGIFTVLILVITAFAGCSAPVGSIVGGLASSITNDGLEIVPKRVAYDRGEWFRVTGAEVDLEVFTVYKGERSPSISLDKCEIWYIDDPVKPEDAIRVQENRQLTSNGRKAIQVNYNNLSDRYFIQVLDSGDNSQPGISIKWEGS